MRRRYRFPFLYDATLWEKHRLRLNDPCPLCGRPLALLKVPPVFRFVQRYQWLACTGAPECGFAVRYQPEPAEDSAASSPPNLH